MNQMNNLERLIAISSQYSDAIIQLWKCVQEHRYSALLGPRYSGKTDILDNLVEKVTKERGYICVKINLYDLNLSTNTLFLGQLIDLISEVLSERSGYQLDVKYPDGPNNTDFRAFIQYVLLKLETHIVLILDHLEALPRDFIYSLLTSLRAQYMEQQSQPFHLITMVSGSLSLATQATGAPSPFHNIATRVIVKELSRIESEALLNYELTGNNAHISPNAKKLFLDSTQGDSFLVQELIQRCIQIGRKRSSMHLNVGIVRQVVEEFFSQERADYPPFLEGVRLIEDDPDLLQSFLILLEHGTVPKSQLPLLPSPDIDPLDLTSLVQRSADNQYRIRNEVYRRFLLEKFNPGRTGSLFMAHGRWDIAIHYLEKSIKSGDYHYRSNLLETTLNAMYGADNVSHASYYLLNGLEIGFGIEQAKIWVKVKEKDVLRQVEELGFDKQITAQEIQINQDSLEGRAFRGQTPVRDQNADQSTKIVFPLILTGGQTIGLASIYNYSPVDRELDIQLYGYLNRAARALSEVGIRQRQSQQIQNQGTQIQRKADLLYLLYRVSTLIQSMTNLSKVLHLILTAITAHFGLRFNRAWIFLVNAEQTHFDGQSAIGELTENDAYHAWDRFEKRTFDEYIESLLGLENLEPTQIDTIIRDLHIPNLPHLEDSFSFVLSNRRMIQWSRNSNKYGIMPDEFQRQFEINEALITPLLVEKDCVGLLIVDNKFSNRPTDSNDEELLSTFANLAAMAIIQDRRRLSEHNRLEIAETFREVSRILSRSLEINKVLDSVLQQMGRVLPFDTASIQWLDEEKTGLKIIRSIGFKNEETIDKLCFPLTGNYPNVDVFHTQEIKRYSDIREVYKHFSEPGYGVQQVRSWLGAPLITDGRSMGVITLDHNKIGVYNQNHEAIALTFASQATLAIENAKSYLRQLQQKEYLSKLIQSSFDAIIAVDRKGFITEYNPQAEHLCGYTHDEIFGSHIHVHKLYSNLKDPKEIQQRLDRDKGVEELEINIVNKRGQRIPILLSAIPLFDKNGNDDGSVGFFKDRRRDMLVKSVGEEITKLQTGHINVVLDRITKNVCSFIGADSAIIHSYLEDQNIYDIRHIGCYGISRESKNFSVKFQTPSYTKETLLQDKNNPLMIVDDVHAGFDRSKTIAISVSPDSFLSRDKVKAFSRISLRINDEKVGTLFVNFRTTHFWTEDELNVAQVFATQAAVAIRQSRLFNLSRKEHRAIEVVNRIARLIDNTSINRLWETILRGSKYVTRAQKGRILVRDENTNRFFSQSAFGFEKDDYSCFDDHGEIPCLFLQKIVKKQDILLIVDSTLDPFPDCCEKCSNIRSLLAAPIIDPNNRVKGILLLASSKPSAFDNTDKNIIKNLASYAGTAIKNALNHNEIQGHIRLLEGLLQAFSGVTTQDNLQHVLQTIADGTREALKCDVVTLYKYDSEKDEIVFPPTISGELIDESALKVLGYVSDNSVVRELFNGGQNLFESNVLNNVRLNTQKVYRKKGYKSFVEREEIRSTAAIVLEMHNNKVGILFANYRRPHHFSQVKINALNIFASEAAVAINDTDLYGQLEQKKLHLEAVYEASEKVTSSLERNEILDHILQQVVMKITPIKGSSNLCGSLHLYDAKRNELILESVFPKDEHQKLIQKIGERLSLRRVVGRKFGIIARAAVELKPQNISKVIKDRDYIRYNFDTKSELAVPLIDGNNLLGVLDVESNDENSFDLADIEAIQVLARLTIVALRNADLAQKTIRSNAVASMSAWGAELAHGISAEVAAIRRNTFKIDNYLQDIPPEELHILIKEIDQFAMNLSLPPLPREPLSDNNQLENPAILDDVLRSECKEYRAEFPDIEIKTSFNCKDVKVSMHERWLKRVLGHLIRNSSKALDNQVHPVIRLKSQIRGGFALIEIADNGIGIDRRKEKLLFQQPIEPSPDHSGRGLLIVRFLVEQHGGDVGVRHGNNQKGACLFFTLQIVTPHASN